MAYSDNLMAMEQPWAAVYRPAFADSWSISDIFTKETDTIAKALQNSFTACSSDGDEVFPAKVTESFLANQASVMLNTQAVSGVSENEAAVSKPQRIGPLGPQGGRVTKRKSRKSKRTVTTFITADPSNFRQMVQQVTGVRFTGEFPAALLLKPEPQRAVVGPIQAGGAFPGPTTSSFFLDRSATPLVPHAEIPPPSPVVVDGCGGGSYVAGLDFDSFCSFPTLESWEVL